ncbi:MAG: pentapeptide repeat-containing protein [Candidatus Methylomirabilales bacterium]
MNEKVEEPQEQPSDRAPMPEEELQKILEAHRKWVESEGKEGKKADLARANLRGAHLFEANLQGASLNEANLQNAFLLDADLEGANLAEANLEGADLLGAQLKGVNLQSATNLTAADVNRAENWELAFYSDDFLKQLGLPPDHNERLEKKLAELEKEKKATGAKP